MASVARAAEAEYPVAARSERLRAAAWVVAVICSGLAVARFGVSGDSFLAVFFVCVLVVISVVDLERRIIPNRIVLPAAGFVLAAHALLSPERAPEWAIASVGAALFLLVPLLVYPAGMGMGDVKLALLLGAMLGRGVVSAFTVAFVAAAIVGVAILVVRGAAARKTAIPFGPFLAAGAIAALFLADAP